jgi:hypothetical protein
MTDRPLRRIAAPFMVPGPTGVSVRTRLKGLTAEDEQVLRAVGAHLGSLAAADLKVRCADGLEGGNGRWAERSSAGGSRRQGSAAAGASSWPRQVVDHRLARSMGGRSECRATA